MGGAARKLKSDSGILAYLLLQPEPGLDQTVGTFADPSGAFRELGITDGMTVTPGEMATLSCMTWGLNPRASRMAVRPSGEFNLRPFATAIWRQACLPERKRIAGQLAKRFGLSIAPWDPPSAFARKLANAATQPEIRQPKGGIRSAHQRVEEAMIVASRCVAGTDFCLTDGASLDRTTGYGHIFTAPREVSILYALGDLEVRQQITAIFDDATRAALDYYNRYAGRTRARNGGANRDVPCRFVAVHYRHITARPVTIDIKSMKTIPLEARLGNNHDLLIDPHLHYHLLILNLARDYKGHFRSIESRYLLIARRGAEATFDTALAWGLKQKFGMTPRKQAAHNVGFGLKEIGPDLVGHFAHRKEEVDQYSAARHDDFEGATDEFTDKSVARTTTRRRKEWFEPAAIHRHWQLRFKALGLGQENVARFLRACRTSFGQDSGEDKVLDADSIIAIADQQHRDGGRTPFVSGEDIRVEVLHQYLGHADSQAILDICDVAMQRMVNLGAEAKKARYATTGYCLLERNVFQLAEQGLSSKDVLANLAFTERQILAVDPLLEWVYRAASQVLSSNARARYLEASDAIDHDLFLTTIRTILQSRGVQYRDVVAGNPKEIPTGTGMVPLAKILDEIRNKTLNIANGVLILSKANSVPAHEMKEILEECGRGNLLLIAADRASSSGGIFPRMLHNRILKRGSGIYRQISNRSLDPDDTKIAEMIRDGQTKRLWQETGLADKLAIEETTDAAIETLATHFVNDRREFPQETQLVMAISEATIKRIRRTIELKCRILGLPTPLKHVIVTTGNTDDRHCERSYVLTEGQDQHEQYICRTRHHQSCFQVASIESLHAWLLGMTNDDPAVTIDGVRQAAQDILACQWSRRYKSSAADYFDEFNRLGNLPILASSAFATTMTKRLSLEKLKIATEDLRQDTLREPEPDSSGISRLSRVHDFLAKQDLPALSADLSARNLGWYLNRNQAFWNRARPVFQKALRSLLEDAQAIEVKCPTISSPTSHQDSPRKGTENDLQSIHIATAARVVGQGALVAIERTRYQAAYKRGCNPGIH